MKGIFGKALSGALLSLVILCAPAVARAGNGQNDCTKANALWEADRCVAKVRLPELMRDCCRKVEAEDYACGGWFGFTSKSFIDTCTQSGEDQLQDR